MYVCYHCGYLTPDRGKFVGDCTDDDHHWMVFICPQCSTKDPKVSEVDSHAPWKMPEWKLVESNHGLCVQCPAGTGVYSAPIAGDHPVLDLPARMIHPGEQGTIRDVHKALVEDGRRRSAAFHAAVEALGPYPPNGTPAWVEHRTKVNEIRRELRIGPHGMTVEHDGPMLTRHFR